MRAYLIDPAAKTVTEVDVPKSASARDIAKMLDCNYIESVNFSNGDVILVDEEARLKKAKPEPFRLRGYYVLLGKALIVGVKNHDWYGARTPLRQVVAMTMFHDESAGAVL
jgi:hypothetical protein